MTRGISAYSGVLVEHHPCYICGERLDSMASVFEEPGKAVAWLCHKCYEDGAARSAFATAFIAGDFGQTARVSWFCELPEGGAQLLQADRSRASGRALAAFIGKMPLRG